MQVKLNWHAYSNNDRNKIIEDVKEAISTGGGCIVNFNMFSDLALSLTIEVEENRIQELYNLLSLILIISDFNPENLNPKSRKEWLVFMNISFAAGKGKLKKEIPEVP